MSYFYLFVHLKHLVCLLPESPFVVAVVEMADCRGWEAGERGPGAGVVVLEGHQEDGAAARADRDAHRREQYPEPTRTVHPLC